METRAGSAEGAHRPAGWPDLLIVRALEPPQRPRSASAEATARVCAMDGFDQNVREPLVALGGGHAALRQALHSRSPRSPSDAGLVFTTRGRTALAQQVGRAWPPAQSGARARCERHAIAVLSQGSTWGSGGWGSSPRRPRQRGGLRTRCRAGQGPSSIRRSRSHTRRHAPWRWRAVRVGRAVQVTRARGAMGASVVTTRGHARGRARE